MESKKAFVDACNNIDGVDFIKASLLYLSGVSGKDELNEFVNIFGGVSKIKTIEESVDLKSLCVLLRDKVYDILIANGDVPENSYINLYSYYAVCSLEEDARYTAYEQFIDQHVLSKDISDMERMYLIVLRFFASMANSRKNAFDKFLSVVMRLNMVEVGSVDFAKHISDFINDSKIEFDEILDILSKLWDKNFYFSLPKTERRSIFNWSLHSLWLVQKYFNHPDWVSLYPQWKAILYEHIERNECDEAMYVQFFIYHKMGNSFQTQEEWKVFNDEIDRPASNYYKTWCEGMRLPKCKKEVNNDPGKKTIIGFLWDRFTFNSPFKVTYSLWKSLYDNLEFRDKYEIKIYAMSYFEKSINDGQCINMVENLGIDVFDGAIPFYNEMFYHSHLDKALYIRNQMLSDGVDILISPNNGYDISDFLITSRVAPKQIYWSHGNEAYNIDSIDKKITHLIYDKKYGNFEHFTMTIASCFRNYEAAIERAKEIRKALPSGKVILGTIGRLIKLDNDEYLSAIKKIMEENQNTIYLACGSGNIDDLRKKTEQFGISDKFIFTGYVDAHIYGYIIDLWLDTFPMHQGESMSEYSSKGRAFLRLLDNDHAIKVMVDSCGLNDMCRDWAIDVSDYIRVASNLIKNNECRFKLGDINLHNGSLLADEMISRGSEAFTGLIK